MNNKKRITITIKYFLLFFLFLLIYTQISLGEVYGPLIFPDEIGYWGSAAKMKGYDWSGVLSLNSYYSYGYGILLRIILGFTTDAIMAYRLAIVMNAIFMGISLVLIYQIGRKLFPKEEKVRMVLTGSCGILYSAFLFYMQTTLTEVILMMLYLAIVYLLICYIQNPKCIFAISLAFILVYTYFVHMRTIAIIIAAVMTLLILGIRFPKYRKTLIIFFLFMGIALIAGIFLKEEMTNSLYSAANISTLQGNDYGGQWDKIKSIFSVDGIKKFLFSIIGKFFYLGIATFGTIYYGIASVIRNLSASFKKKEAVCLIWFFLGISFIGQFLITSIYMLEGSYVDTTLYGRYHEMILPVLIMMGIKEMIRNKKLFRNTVCIVIGQSLLLGAIAFYWRTTDAGFRHTCFVIGVNYAADRSDFNRNQFALILFIVGIFFYLSTALLMYLIQKDYKWNWLLSLFLFGQLAISWDASKDYTYIHNEYNYSDILVGMEMREKAAEGKEIYFDPSWQDAEYIGLMQLGLMEYPIHVIPKGEKDYYTPENIIVTYYNNENLEELSNKYKKMRQATHFVVFYNP